ncbi:MAG: zf-TFIIB domain-containing protein [Minicystis sp.]
MSATVRCAACFHLNVSDAQSCSACGGELGLEPIGEPTGLPCPGCTGPLHAFRSERGVLHDCGTCNGQLVEHALLVDMIAHRQARGAARPSTGSPAAARAVAVRYVPCPVCGALMNRRNFGRASGVIVDICKEHGTWFDAGELPRVLLFAEAAGAAKARDRAAPMGPEQRRAIGATLPRYDENEAPPLCDGSAFGERVVEVLGMILGVTELALDVTSSDL